MLNNFGITIIIRMYYTSSSSYYYCRSLLKQISRLKVKLSYKVVAIWSVAQMATLHPAAMVITPPDDLDE